MTMTNEQRSVMLDLLGHDGVGTRLLNALGRNDINTPEQLKEVTDETISRYRTVGSTCMNRLAEARRRLDPAPEKRMPDESLDRVTEFYEKLASAVKKDRGILLGEDFNTGERRLIISDLKRQAAYYRLSAEERREDTARQPE